MGLRSGQIDKFGRIYTSLARKYLQFIHKSGSVIFGVDGGIMRHNLREIMRKLVLLFAVICFSQTLLASNGLADGMPEDAPAKKVARPAPPQEAPKQQPAVAPVQTIDDDWCEWKFRLSPGATVWFFDKESTLLGPAAFLDFWRTDYPINYRIGVEGRHMYLGQPEADFAREYFDKTTHITFIRIPFAVEYMHTVNDNTTWYLGGGPDIIHTANDLSDTNVGMHLGTRLHYAFNEKWGMAIEAGYMWGDVDGEGADVKLDNAYITPTLTYSF